MRVIRIPKALTEERVEGRWLVVQALSLFGGALIFLGLLFLLEAEGSVRPIESKEILESLTLHLQGQLEPETTDRVQVTALSQISRINASEASQIRWDGPKLLESGPRSVFQFHYLNEFGEAKSGYLNVALAIEGSYLVAARTVMARQELSSSDFMLVRKLIAPTSYRLLQRVVPSEARARSLIPKDSILTKNAWEGLPVIRAGNPVEVLISEKGIRVQLMGMARQEGRKDDVIQVSVQNKLFRARVLNSAKVEIQ